MSILSWRVSDRFWLFLFFVSLYSLTMSGHLYTADGVLAFQTTRSLAEQGTLELPDAGFLTLENINGRPVSRYPWGQPILLVPFYWLGELADILLPGEAAGRETWCLWSVTFSSAIVGAFLVLVTHYLSLVLGADRRGALAAAFAAGCGSIFWVYSQDLFRNPMAALLLTLTVAFLFRVRVHPKYVHAAGLSYLVLIQVRMDSLLALPILLGWLIWAGRPDGINRFRWAWFWWITWSAGGMILLGVNNWVRFGNPLRHNIPNAFFTESLLISIPGFLWSPDKSMFLYSPPLLLTLIAVPTVWRRCRAETIVVLALFVVYMVWYGKYHHWFGGRCWGPRYTILFTPLLLAMLGPWLSQVDNRSNLRWVVTCSMLGIGTIVQLSGVLVEQNVHLGLHHLKGISIDIVSGNLDPWWARSWASHPYLTLAGALILVAVAGLSLAALASGLKAEESQGEDTREPQVRLSRKC